MTNAQEPRRVLPDQLSERDKRTVRCVQAGYAYFGEQWDQLIQLNNELPLRGERKVDVACRAGCAACCTYLVDTMEAEAITIAIAVQTQLEPAPRSTLLLRLLAWEHEFNRWLKRHPMPPPVVLRKGVRRPEQMTDLMSNPAHTQWRTQWQAARKVCPFLNLSDYTCGIYALRPTTCRAHHAAYPPPDAPPEIRQPPEGCFTTVDDVRRGTLNPIWQINNELGERWSFMLGETLRRANLPWQPGMMLPIAVLEAGRQRFGWPKPRDVGVEVPTLPYARKQAPENV